VVVASVGRRAGRPARWSGGPSSGDAARGRRRNRTGHRTPDEGARARRDGMGSWSSRRTRTRSFSPRNPLNGAARGHIDAHTPRVPAGRRETSHYRALIDLCAVPADDTCLPLRLRWTPGHQLQLRSRPTKTWAWDFPPSGSLPANSRAAAQDLLPLRLPGHPPPRWHAGHPHLRGAGGVGRGGSGGHRHTTGSGRAGLG